MFSIEVIIPIAILGIIVILITMAVLIERLYDKVRKLQTSVNKTDKRVDELEERDSFNKHHIGLLIGSMYGREFEHDCRRGI